MTRWFGSGPFVIPNLFRDLGFGFRIWVLKPRPVGGVLYYIQLDHSRPTPLPQRFFIKMLLTTKQMYSICKNSSE